MVLRKKRPNDNKTSSTKSPTPKGPLTPQELENLKTAVKRTIQELPKEVTNLIKGLEFEEKSSKAGDPHIKLNDTDETRLGPVNAEVKKLKDKVKNNEILTEEEHKRLEQIEKAEKAQEIVRDKLNENLKELTGKTLEEFKVSSYDDLLTYFFSEVQSDPGTIDFLLETKESGTMTPPKIKMSSLSDTMIGTGKQDTGAKQDTTSELEKIKNKVKNGQIITPEEDKILKQNEKAEQTEKETKQGTGKQDTGAKQDTTSELEKIKNKVKNGQIITPEEDNLLKQNEKAEKTSVVKETKTPLTPKDLENLKTAIIKTIEELPKEVRDLINGLEPSGKSANFGDPNFYANDIDMTFVGAPNAEEVKKLKDKVKNNEILTEEEHERLKQIEKAEKAQEIVRDKLNENLKDLTGKTLKEWKKIILFNEFGKPILGEGTAEPGAIDFLQTLEKKKILRFVTDGRGNVYITEWDVKNTVGQWRKLYSVIGEAIVASEEYPKDGKGKWIERVVKALERENIPLTAEEKALYDKVIRNKIAEGIPAEGLKEELDPKAVKEFFERVKSLGPETVRPAPAKGTISLLQRSGRFAAGGILWGGFFACLGALAEKRPVTLGELISASIVTIGLGVVIGAIEKSGIIILADLAAALGTRAAATGFIILGLSSELGGAPHPGFGPYQLPDGTIIEQSPWRSSDETPSPLQIKMKNGTTITLYGGFSGGKTPLESLQNYVVTNFDIDFPIRRKFKGEHEIPKEEDEDMDEVISSMKCSKD